MTKQLIHLPSHQGKIKSGRVAEFGETITCPACRKIYMFRKEQAARLGQAAIKSATENWTPEGYSLMGAERYSGMMARAAVVQANYFFGYEIKENTK